MDTEPLHSSTKPTIMVAKTKVRRPLSFQPPSLSRFRVSSARPVRPSGPSVPHPPSMSYCTVFLFCASPSPAPRKHSAVTGCENPVRPAPGLNPTLTEPRTVLHADADGRHVSPRPYQYATLCIHLRLPLPRAHMVGWSV